MKQVKTSHKADRRNYFRIDDVTVLSHRTLSNTETDNEGHANQLSIDKLTLKARFEALSREMKPMSRAVDDANPKLARYLSAIDQKLNMLSEVLMNNAVDDLNQEPQRVNISAGGLSFESSEPITPGSLLELRFILQPSNIGIYSHARVVLCKKDSNEQVEKRSYKVAVEFIRLDEEFRDLISRHVLGREQATMASDNKT